jgi:tetratricopeptide (TPR) repeat protein
VAKAIEAMSDDLDEDAALLAHHHEAASDAVTAARWNLRAADWIGTTDVHATERHSRAVLALLREREAEGDAAGLLAQACARLLALGWRLGMEEEAARLHVDGRRWARAAGDLDAEARVAGAYAAVLAVAGRLEESAAVGDEFNRLAEQLGDPEMRAVAHAWMTYPPLQMGRLEEAEARLLAGIRAGERQPDLGQHFIGSSITGFLLWWLVDVHVLTRPWPEVAEDIERSLRWARARRESESESFALIEFRYLATGTGEVDVHLPRVRQALALAEEMGSAALRTAAKLALGACLVEAGEPEEALPLIDAALVEAREARTNLEFEADYESRRALALLALGRSAEALASAREALVTCEARLTRRLLPDVLCILARCELAIGELDAAAGTLDRAEIEVRAMGAVNPLPMIVWGRADVAAQRGDIASQRALLEEALAGLRERGATGHARSVERVLEALGS